MKKHIKMSTNRPSIWAVVIQIALTIKYRENSFQIYIFPDTPSLAGV